MATRQDLKVYCISIFEPVGFQTWFQYVSVLGKRTQKKFQHWPWRQDIFVHGNVGREALPYLHCYKRYQNQLEDLELPESLIQSWQHLTVQLLMARNSALRSMRAMIRPYPTLSNPFYHIQKIPEGDSQLLQPVLWILNHFRMFSIVFLILSGVCVFYSLGNGKMPGADGAWIATRSLRCENFAAEKRRCRPVGYLCTTFGKTVSSQIPPEWTPAVLSIVSHRTWPMLEEKTSNTATWPILDLLDDFWGVPHSTKA